MRWGKGRYLEMKKWGLLLLLVLVAATVVDDHQRGYVECCVEEERLALFNIKSYMQSHSTKPKYDDDPEPKPWLWFESGATEDCCEWDGVVCNASTGRVTQLDLSVRVNRNDDDKPWKFNVTVFRPFRELISLDLSWNYLHCLVEDDGSTKMTSLKKLQVLKLDGNRFHTAGCISVSGLTSLRTLSLYYAGLNKSQELPSPRALQKLNLGGNSFASIRELMSYVSNLGELQVLDLSDNVFHGTIEGTCKMKNLLELHLNGNSLHGVLPSCIRNLTYLQIFDLSQNHFTGKLPKLISNLKSINYLQLSYNNFNGEIPKAISTLEFLKYLDLSNNYFEGKFSLGSLGNLSNLHVLRLSSNNLDVQFGDPSWRPNFQLQTLSLQNCNLNKTFEAFPRFWSHQTNLFDLDLSNNNLHEPFPTWLFNQNSKLRALYLANNSFKGNLQLPPSACMSMEILHIGNNNLHGKLPNSIGLVCPQLRYLNLSRNHFEGPIPASIGHMRGLKYLDLSNNKFQGELPSIILSNLNSLKILMLSDNDLEGDIIPEDMNLPSLDWLELRNNHFGGSIKDALLKSSEKLYYLDISNNNITGQLPRWIGNFSELMSLSLSQNKLHGHIPREICNLELGYLDLSLNNFSGPIPSCSNICSFSFMHLHNNHLSGIIPDALSGCLDLNTLDLRDNQLSGGFPSWIDKLSNLTILLLAGNNLQGQIPKQLCRLSNINILDLSRNHLSGEIPLCIGRLSFGVTIREDYDGLESTVLEESIEMEIYKTPEEIEFLNKNQFLSYRGKNVFLISVLDLSSNKLTGEIPLELGRLEQLRTLNLSRNFLSGSIPSQFSNLKDVESLDLSYNHLSGKFPIQLSELTSLAVFNVSYNNLSGRVPDTPQFTTFDESSYRGNPRLYGWNHESQNPNKSLPGATNSQDDEGDEDEAGIIDMVDFLWSFSVTCFIMFLTTIAVLYINPRWSRAWFEFVDYHSGGFLSKLGYL